MKKLKWVSWHKQAERAHLNDCEEHKTTFETAVVRTRRSATADCDVVKSLVFQYETALREGKNQRGALGRVEDIMLKAVNMALCPKENHILLAQAMEAGDLARKAMTATLDDLGRRDMQVLTVGIHACQEMMKANPLAIDLPFIRNTMRYILWEQKYGDKPLDARDTWGGFLHTRPKKKMLHSPVALRRLIGKAREEGKPIDAYDTVAEALGVSESFLKKATAVKERGPGRSKKSR